MQEIIILIATKVNFFAKIKTTIQLFTLSIYLLALAMNKFINCN